MPVGPSINDDWGELIVANGHVYVSTAGVLVEIDGSGNVVRNFETGSVKPVLLEVSAPIASNRTLYVGGKFATFGGKARRNLAAIDLATGQVTDWNPRPDEPVSALATAKGLVYVGGDFAYIGDQVRHNLAAFDTSGLVTNWSPPAISGCDRACVRGMTATDNAVYVLGDFTKVGDKDRNGIARIDANGAISNWNPRITSQRSRYFGSDFNGIISVSALGNGVFIGGLFSSINSILARNGAAAVDVFGNVSSWNPNVNGSVYSLALNGDSIYLGGDFTLVGGESRNRLAAVGTQPAAAVTSWSPNVDGLVRALVVKGSTVYVGGSFSNVSGQARNGLAAVDLNGSLSAWNPGTDGKVRTIAISGGVVYVGGEFSMLGGQPRKYLAAVGVNGGVTTWQPTVSNCVNQGLANKYEGFFDACVESITVVGNTIYVGGEQGLDSYDGAGQRVSTFVDDSSLISINSVAILGDGILVGAHIRDINDSGSFTFGLALTSLTGSLNRSWNPAIAGEVDALALFGNSILVGGQILGAGGAPRGGFAVVNFDGTVR